MMQLLPRGLELRLIAVSVAIVVGASMLVGVVVAKLSEQEVQSRLLEQAESAANLVDAIDLKDSSFSSLSTEILRNKINNTGSIWIIDKSGKLIANPDPDKFEDASFGNSLIELTTVVLPQMSDKKGIERKMPLKEAVNRYEAGFGTFGENIQNGTKVFAFKAIPSKGLLVGIDEPLAAKHGAADSLKKYILMTCLILGVAILFSTIMSISFIIKPYYREKLELSDRVESANRNLKKLHEVSVGMQRSLALEERIKKVLGSAHEVLGLDRIFIFLPNEENSMLECKGAFGNQDEPSDQIKLPIERGGVIAKTYIDRKIHRVMNVHELPAELRLQHPFSEIRALRSRSYVALPMVVENNCLGVVMVDNQLTKNPIEDEVISSLELFTGQAAVAIENAQLYRRLQSHADDLEVTDHLTKLFTFSHFKVLLQKEIDNIQSSGFNLSMAIFSVQDFAAYNKCVGSADADNLLLTIADSIRGHVGDSGVIGRCFGSTMAVLFVSQEYKAAKNVCYEILSDLQQKQFAGKEMLSDGRIRFISRFGEYVEKNHLTAEAFFTEVSESSILV